MTRFLRAKMVVAYVLLVFLAAVGYSRWDRYTLDGDGVAFLDISQALASGPHSLAINGYWNPGYPAALAVGRVLAHPSRLTELGNVRGVNVLIFTFSLLASLFLSASMVKLRRRFAFRPAVSEGVLYLLGPALLLISAGRELPLAAVRSDTLLLALLLLAAGIVLRLQDEGRFFWYPLLGATLGCAYLTKSFAFLPSLALIAALLLAAVLGSKKKLREERRILIAGAATCGLVFALVAGPYIWAISHQLGYFTSGDSARMNYCFFVDQTPRWHEWYWHDLGHATGLFRHPEQVLAGGPAPLYSYASHPNGTFPLWFDPAYWTAGLKPHFWLRGHLVRLVRCTELLVRFMLARPEVLVLLAVLLAFGARLPRMRDHLPWWPPAAWGLLMLGIYFPVDLQDRYLTGPWLLMLLPLFAWLRDSEVSSASEASPSAPVWTRMQTVCAAAIVLFAGITLLQAFGQLAEFRRNRAQYGTLGKPLGYGKQIFEAAEGLNKLGVDPGGKIACFGSQACYVDHYWARLAGVQILAEVETPNDSNPESTWNSIPDKHTITAPLQAMGIHWIVGMFPNSAHKPDGWVQLGTSDFFAYPIQPKS